MKFDSLVSNIHQTHEGFQRQAAKAVDLSLTLRNWLIGYYIFEFEQRGEDRAAYGQGLILNLAKKVSIDGLSSTNLKLNRQFYCIYPQLAEVIITEMKKMGMNAPLEIGQTVSDQFQFIENQNDIRDFVSSRPVLGPPPDKLMSHLSFSHFVELMSINDREKRLFYELECIRANWNVRELKRQINSLYAERSAISKQPDVLRAKVAAESEKITPQQIVKSIYSFEFLGLKAKDVVEESDLEIALLDNLQDFLLEMGHGFCLEARQKRLLIGNEYFFIDLVLYHRILKPRLCRRVRYETPKRNKIKYSRKIF